MTQPLVNRLRFTVAVVSCLGLITACTDSGETVVGSPASGSAGSATGSSTTAPGTRSASPTGSVRAAASPTSTTLPAAPPVAIDPAMVAGTNSGVMVDAARAVFATWPVITGAPDLNATMVSQTRADVARLQKAGAGEINQQWSFVAVGPDLLGVRIVTTSRSAPGRGTPQSRSAYRTVWYSVSDKETYPAAQLFSAGQIENVRQEVVRQVAARTGVAHATVDARITTEALDSVAFDQQTGDVVVELDDATVGTGRQAVRVPAGQAESRLSALGRAALDGTRRPRPLNGDAAPTAEAPAAVPATSVDCRVRRCVALAFASGPSAGTADVLEALSAAKAPATFFPVGTLATVRPDLVRRAAAAGHEIGIGTADHTRLTGLTAEQQRLQLTEGAAVVTDAGAPAPNLLLPPYNSLNPLAMNAARELAGGAPSVIRPTLDSLDWRNRDAARTVATVKAGVRPGSIVVLRDSEPTTAQAVAPLITTLRAAGYTLVTVDQALAPLRPVGARTYDRGAAPVAPTASATRR